MKNAIRLQGKESDIRAAKWELEYEDVFHFKNMYKYAKLFLVEQGWKDPHDGGPNWEAFYYEKVLPHGAKEYRIWWRVVMVPDDNPYIRYMMNIDYLGLNLDKATKVVDGVKFSSWKGNPAIRCEAWLQLDYQNLWAKSTWLGSFEKFFKTRIYKPYYSQHKKQLHRKSYQFNRALKVYLGLKTPADEDEPYRNPGGTPV